MAWKVLVGFVLGLALGPLLVLDGGREEFLCPEGTRVSWGEERPFEELAPMRTVGCVKADGSLHGPALKWHGDHLMTAARYRDGALEGTLITWHENGQRWTLAEYRAGLPVGTRTTWTVEGVRDYEEVFHGDGSSTSRFWYEGGAPKWRGTLRGDELHGEFESWHESGAPRTRGFYQDGKKHGDWVCHDESGRQRIEATFEAGDVIDATGGTPDQARELCNPRPPPNSSS